MTDTAKTTLWIVIILIIVSGIWWYVGSNGEEAQAPAPQNTEVVATTTEQTPVEDASTSISIKDSSDGALDTDLGKVDSQLSELSVTSSI